MDIQNPGKFYDEFLITLRKAKKFPDSTYVQQYNSQKQCLPSFMEASVLCFDSRVQLVLLLMELMMVHTDIWNLEADIRQGQEGRLGLEEVGRRALEIRGINGRRIQIVNEINALFDVPTVERKFDHASE